MGACVDTVLDKRRLGGGGLALSGWLHEAWHSKIILCLMKRWLRINHQNCKEDLGGKQFARCCAVFVPGQTS